MADASGAIKVFDTSGGEPVLYVYLCRNKNWLGFARHGYFGGTREAAQNLFLSTSANETISSDSLLDSLYPPDVVAAAAGGDEKGRPQGGRRKGKHRPIAERRAAAGECDYLPTARPVFYI
ncbi:hypothetical protein QO004_004487 [Rhizobium mesoamericanum]|uniref:hypothetical protein n=1 Tax=Rhizobium mesoamericanum TaxID=1079800 RepID=UPI0027825519|nr:hypothetical protein [Rhizobium mesoamericanum]MDQ0562682.1 hypothetical protein [Rhizobium mesoamericanum]